MFVHVANENEPSAIQVSLTDGQQPSSLSCPIFRPDATLSESAAHGDLAHPGSLETRYCGAITTSKSSLSFSLILDES